MQAQTAASNKQFGIGPVKNIALALGVAATLAVGAVSAAVIRSDDAGTQAPSAAVSQSHAYSDWRFLEINQLPSASAAVTRSAEEIRFLEINMLPEAAVAAPVLYETTRFLEINMLPEAPVAPVLHDTMRFLEINQLPVALQSANTVDMRFWEINQLPGDNVQNLAPSADRLGERH